MLKITAPPLALLPGAFLAGTALASGSGVFVNGVELPQETVDAYESLQGVRIADAALSDEQIAAIKAAFGVEVRNNRFWYDPISGAWGYEGLPAAGRVQPFLPLGGPLKPDASGGGSDVVVNGRILHPTEVAYLKQRFGSVQPGRYFLLANGAYGFEGGPILGTLNAQRRSSYGPQDKFGSVLGDGGFVSYSPPSGSLDGVSVSCAPDGGCIYN